MDLGLNTTLTDSNSILDPQVLAIGSAINPTLAAEFGRVWDLFAVRQAPIETDEYQILTRNYTAPQVTTGTSTSGNLWDSASATTGLPISYGTIDRITVGDVLLLESEIVVVKSVDRGANTIDVYERGAGETAGAAHGTTAKTAQVIGNAHREGRVDGEAMAEGTNKITNYTQLVQELVDLSKDNLEQERKYGRTEDTLRTEAMNRVMRDLARTAIYGVSRQNTSSIPGMTRGLLEHLRLASNLKVSVGGAFSETVLKNGLDAVRAAGGKVNAIVMSISKKRTFNTFTGANSVQVDRSSRVGGFVLDGYIADGFNEPIPAVVDLDMPDNAVALVSTPLLQKGWKKGDELRFAVEPNTNSRELKENLQGKFGLGVEGVDLSHYLIDNLS